MRARRSAYAAASSFASFGAGDGERERELERERRRRDDLRPSLSRSRRWREDEERWRRLCSLSSLCSLWRLCSLRDERRPPSRRELRPRSSPLPPGLALRLRLLLLFGLRLRLRLGLGARYLPFPLSALPARRSGLRARSPIADAAPRCAADRAATRVPTHSLVLPRKKKRRASGPPQSVRECAPSQT